jgi:hypothetical protein
MKRQAALEVQRTVAEAELIKSAAQEELEAQRIYAEAARLETESLEVLAQVRAKLGEQASSVVEPEGHWETPDFQADQMWESEEPEEASPSSEVEPEPVQQEEAPSEEVSKSPRSRKGKSSSQTE